MAILPTPALNLKDYATIASNQDTRLTNALSLGPLTPNNAILAVVVVGHLQAECPTVRNGGGNGRCHNCGRYGHLARNCTANGYGRGGGGRGGYSSRVICYKCGGANHFARDCKANGVKCYNCGRFGHYSRDCTNSQGDKSVKTCYRCKERGHISKDCPNALQSN
ncbi:991_t:CDS:2 [Acaulospora morrowiae]|uniref:991_t:CDS:1 n=1 Tax=Acaulospora morrowiae TaxID=94023 RepID=A0A9N9IPV9_9GLOM|nr:991_t:CDS:2 [Acaulospora morrowiae]